MVDANKTELIEEATNSKLREMMRIYTHEVSHIAMWLERISYTLHDAKKYIIVLPATKINDVLEDLNSSVEVLRRLERNVKMVLDGHISDTIDFQYILVFKDIIFKIENVIKHDLQMKNLGFITPEVYLDDTLRPPFFTCKSYLEQILCNLIDNALKYSYWGTNISVDFKKKCEDSSSRVLTVVNYGIAIDCSDAPYELFYRGAKTVESQGAGIGLYVAKRLAEFLCGRIYHKCSLISDYNVPFIEEYLYRDFRQAKDKALLVLLSKELERLIEVGLYNNIVNRKFSRVANNSLSNKIPEQMIIDSICDKTYETIFEVELYENYRF